MISGTKKYISRVLILSIVLVACQDRSRTTPVGPDDAGHDIVTTSNPAVSVDFGAPEVGVKSMSGFLHGISATQPHDTLITQLRPAMWRIGNFNDYDRLVSTFSNPATRPRITFVLSDQWGYPSYDGSHGWPYEGTADPANPYKEWEDFVRDMATKHRDKAVLWEVWNEPDIIPQFWGGTQAQFRETYLRAYEILREVLGPNAMIGGPSYSSYNSWINPQGVNTKDLTRDFLSFCSVNGCEANFLTWHELHPEVPSIKEHLDEIRALVVDYPAVAVRELHVAESVSETGHYRPADQITTLYYLEQGRADAGVKTCWNDSRGELTCFNSTVDGLLTAESFNKTAGWWLYKIYADGVGTRVKSTTNHSYIVSLGSTESFSSKEAQVLIGYMHYIGAPSSTSVQVTLNDVRALPFVSGSKVRVKVQRIPNSGESAVSRLSTIQNAKRTINSDGGVTFSFTANLHEGYVVTIQP